MKKSLYVFYTCVIAVAFASAMCDAICDSITVRHNHWIQYTHPYIYPIWIIIAWIWFMSSRRWQKLTNEAVESCKIAEKLIERQHEIIEDLRKKNQN